jgi:hypothetical protein
MPLDEWFLTSKISEKCTLMTKSKFLVKATTLLFVEFTEYLADSLAYGLLLEVSLHVRGSSFLRIQEVVISDSKSKTAYKALKHFMNFTVLCGL